MASFKILQSLTCGFEPGDPLRDSREFPEGTDFQRLIDIGAVRLVDGTAPRPADAQLADLMDEVEELTEKLAKEKEGRAAAVAELKEARAACAEKDRVNADLCGRYEAHGLTIDKLNADVERLKAELEIAKTPAVPDPAPKPPDNPKADPKADAPKVQGSPVDDKGNPKPDAAKAKAK